MTTAFTNGCFDILTVAHVRLLKLAGEHDTLIVGLNSDKSVRALKGEGRPVNSQEHRAEVLRSVRWVDDVIIFDETHVAKLLLELAPDVWIKGGDYTLDSLNKDEVLAAQVVKCRIVLAPYIGGISTTLLLKRL